MQTFLSNELHSLFPGAINSLCPDDGRSTAHAAFGHQFKSVSDARRLSMTSHRLELPPREFEEPWDELLTTHPSFTFPTAALDGQRPASEEMPAVVETPLSPTEEEMFDVLCAAPEWDSATVAAAADTEDGAGAALIDLADNGQEQPLRRSKRVANVATRSRTRSTKRGSRTSLS